VCPRCRAYLLAAFRSEPVTVGVFAVRAPKRSRRARLTWSATRARQTRAQPSFGQRNPHRRPRTRMWRSRSTVRCPKRRAVRCRFLDLVHTGKALTRARSSSGSRAPVYSLCSDATAARPALPLPVARKRRRRTGASPVQQHTKRSAATRPGATARPSAAAVAARSSASPFFAVAPSTMGFLA